MTDPTSPDQPEHPDQPDQPLFGLRWGIKGSFLDYVRRMPDGRAWIGDGAAPVSEHEILYPPVEGGRRPGPDGSTERFWTFRGDVRFSGHAGMLFVRVASPVLVARDEVAELLVADPSSGQADSERLPLVTLRLAPHAGPDGVEVWHGTDVRLTPAGTELFNDVYPPGEPFEPLSVTVPAPGS